MHAESTDRWVLPVGGILLLVLAGYLPALRAGFVLADIPEVVQNPLLVAHNGLIRIWTSAEASQYQPVTYTSFWLERRLLGLKPWTYHLVNVLLHAANAGLVWFLLRRIGLKGATLAAMLFALHPVNVESVAWISERKNVLSGALYLLTLVAFLRFEQDRRARWYAAALLLFVAALLAKASTVVLPAVLLLYWWWRRDGWRGRNVLAILPFIILAGSMAALTVWYEQQYTGATGPEYAAGFAERLARAGWIVAFYLGKFFLPYNLAFYYPRWSVDPAALSSYLPLAVMVAIGFVLIARRRTWERGMLFGLGVYLITLFPVLGFFNIYYQRFSFVADHFQYLGLVPLAALSAHGLACGLDRLGSAFTHSRAGGAGLSVQVAGVLLVAACWTLCWQRSHVFLDNRTIAEDTLRRYPDSWMAHLRLGEYYRDESQGKKERLQLALKHFRRALELKPGHGHALYGIGSTLQQLYREKEGLAYLRRAVAADPDNPSFRIKLGAALERHEGVQGAIAQYEEAMRRSPNFVLARVKLGQALIQDNQIDKGLQRLREAVELRPENLANRVILGQALCSVHRYEEGIAQLREVVRRNPNDSRAVAMLEQMVHLQRVLSTTP